MQERPGTTLERLVPYDDFNATQIDPDKWSGIEWPEPGSAGTEAIRQIRDNRLRLLYRVYGRTAPGRGESRNELGLAFHNSTAVTAIKATVQVTNAAVTSCPDNREVTAAAALLYGRFFSTVPSPPGGAANDVMAAIGLVRRSNSTEPPDVLRVICAVFHCTNADCTAASTLQSEDLGPVKLGGMARLRVQWDRDNHQFVFQRDDDPEVLAPYTVSDSAPPGLQFKRLGAVHFVPDCTASPRPVAFVEALFDDVMVNESATPRAV